MKRAFEDGTAALSFTAEELVSRLVALIPPPRAGTIVYRGVFAGNASLRRVVVAQAPTRSATTPFPRLRRQKEPLKNKRLRPSRGEILDRVFAEEGGRCPGCGCRMTLRTVFEGGPTMSQGASLRRSAAAIHGLDQGKLAAEGLSQRAFCEALTAWVRARTKPRTKPSFVGHNAPFDWSFVSYAYAAEELQNPFGYKALCTKAMATGALGVHWFDSNKEVLAERLRLPAEDLGQKHRADYDAWYQAHILVGLLDQLAARAG